MARIRRIRKIVMDYSLFFLVDFVWYSITQNKAFHNKLGKNEAACQLTLNVVWHAAYFD
jgi:hypothetical protein